MVQVNLARVAVGFTGAGVDVLCRRSLAYGLRRCAEERSASFALRNTVRYSPAVSNFQHY
jgi:hypothetical protein